MTHRIRLWHCLIPLFALNACGGDDPAKPKSKTDPTAGERPIETVCDDGTDNDGDGFADCDDLDCRSVGGACELAAPLDRTVATTVWEAAQFLFTGMDPVQKEADTQSFERHRIAIVSGKVTDVSGEPLGDVRITVRGHAEFGYTLTRADGAFDLAVNGGSRLLLEYEKEGFLSVQRATQPGWQRYAVVGEVGLIERSRDATVVQAAASGAQVAVGTEVEDERGKRQPLVIISPDTDASAVLPDGSEVALDKLSVRMTEYPLEAPTLQTLVNGPRFSPGSLPVSSALSYGVEFSVDEAEKLGATSVQFSEPVVLYVDNFLGLPVGSPVPLGYYSHADAQWQSADAGRVVSVVSVTDGAAALDFDGDGIAEDESALDDFGVTSGELSKIAERYEPGTTLWRGLVSHFSAWNMLFPNRPPPGSVAPSVSSDFSRTLDEPSRRGAAMVETQAVAKTIGVTGTPYSLEYQSDRTAAYRAAYQLEIPLLPETVPENLVGVYTYVTIAGKEVYFQDAPEPNLTRVIEWDGRDSFGRLMQGPQTAHFWIAYGYPGNLSVNEMFGASGDDVGHATAEDGSDVALVFQSFETTLGVWDASAYELGGLSLDVLHAYDPANQTIFYGWGDKRSAQNLALEVRDTVKNFDVGTPDGVVVAPDGAIIVTDDEENNPGAGGRILRIDQSGEVTVLAGPGAPGSLGDVALASPQGVVMTDDGSLIVNDFNKNAVRKIAPDGTVQTLLGPSTDKPLVAANLFDLDGLALGPREELYVVNADEVEKLEGGEFVRFAGGGADDDEVPARDVKLSRPSAVVVAADGTAFISERNGHRVRKVTPDGIIHTIAGTGEPGFSGDTEDATKAQLNEPRGLALAADGSLYIADQGNNRIRRVTPEGIIFTVVGDGADALETGSLADDVQLNAPDGIAFGKDGALYIATMDTVFRVAPGVPELSENENLIPSTDGAALYKFDNRGKHLATIDTMTGVTELEFGYDSQGLLISLKDKNGITTEIERAKDGTPEAVKSQFGQRTEFALTDRIADSVSDPLGRKVEFKYDEGRLTSLLDPKGGEYAFDYEEAGLLTSVTDPIGYKESFGRGVVAGGHSVSVTTPAGLQSTYSVSVRSGALERTVTLPDESTVVHSDLVTTETFNTSDGSTEATKLKADPQFGSQALMPIQTTTKTPAGRLLTAFHRRTKTGPLDDSGKLGPLELDTWTDETEINGRVFTSSYSRKDGTLTTKSAEGRTSTTTYDALGRPTDVTAPGRPATHFDYDDLGRLATVTTEAGGEQRIQKLTYGDDGMFATRTDALGDVVQFLRDPAGRIDQQVRADDRVITFELDNNDNVLSVTPPGRAAHRFTYRDQTNLLEAISPPVIQGADSPTSLPVGESRYVYNEQGDFELTKVQRSDGHDIALAYDDATGQLESIKLASTALTFTYDATGRIASVDRTGTGKVELLRDGPLLLGVTWSGTIDGTVALEYDENFQVKSTTVGNVSTVNYAYDDDGLMTSATGGGNTMTLTRDSDTGFVEAATVDSVSSTYGYSAFAELSSLSTTFAGSGLFSQTIKERDALGRVKHLTETIAGETHDLFYDYDNLGRLTEAERDGVITNYKYDVNGNRESITVDGVETATATYDEQDRIKTHGTQEYTQSAQGDLFRRTDGAKAIELTYDELGGLLRADLSDSATSTTIEYVIDGFGRRIGRKVDGTLQKLWLYHEDLRPIAEVDSDSTLMHFVYAGPAGAPAFMLRAGVPFRIVTDQLGSVRLVVNATTGVVEQRLTYDEFGRVLEDTNPGFQPFGFAGGLYDPDTKLVRFGTRDYDPGMGRWVAKDPIGFAGQSANLYAYCGSDPVNRVDPTGLEDEAAQRALEDAFLSEFALESPTPDEPDPTFDSGTEAALASLRADLEPLARAHIFMLRQAGIKVRISYGARNVKLQTQMYATRKKGFRVAAPGKSAHNYGAAYDIAIYEDNGSYISSGTDWRYQLAGRTGMQIIGLKWGGMWKTDPDYPHYEIPGWSGLPDLQVYTGR